MNSSRPREVGESVDPSADLYNSEKPAYPAIFRQGVEDATRRRRGMLQTWKSYVSQAEDHQHSGSGDGKGCNSNSVYAAQTLCPRIDHCPSREDILRQGPPDSVPLNEGFNDWGGRGYDNFVPGMVTKIAPSGDRAT